MTGKDAYIIEVVQKLIRTHIDRKARVKDKEGIVYYLRIDGEFKRRFITIKKARRIFYDLYGG